MQFDSTLEPYAYDLDLAREYMGLAGINTPTPTPTPTPTETTGDRTTHTIGNNWIISIVMLSLVSIAAIKSKRRTE